MTRLELLNAITWEAKLNGNAEAIEQLPNLLQDIAILLAQSHPEMFVVEGESALLYSDNPTPFVDALGIYRVTITDLVTGEEFDVPYEDKVVGPAAKSIWPKAYSIRGNANTSNSDPKGISVLLYPAFTVNDSTAFTVYWKKVPALDADDSIVPAAWVPYLKKELLARIAMHRAKPEGDNAKLYAAGSQQALQVEISTHTESTSSTN